MALQVHFEQLNEHSNFKKTLSGGKILLPIHSHVPTAYGSFKSKI